MIRILQIVISLVLLSILTYWIDIDQIKDSLVNANYYYLGLAVLIVVVNRVIMAIKWNMLLRTRGIVVSWWDVLKIYYISNFLGLFLPPTVGADFVRAYYISRTRHPLADIVASIIVERALGFIALFIFGLFGALFFVDMVNPERLDISKLIAVIAFVTVIGTGLFSLSFNRIILAFTKNLLSSLQNKKIWNKLTPKLYNLLNSYESYKAFKSVMFVFFILTFVEIFTMILWIYVVAIGIDVEVPFTYFTAFIPIIVILIRLPISLDGFGIHEGGFVYFLALVGIPKGLGFSVGLISHMVTIVGMLPGSIFYALNRKEYKRVVDT